MLDSIVNFFTIAQVEAQLVVLVLVVVEHVKGRA